MNDSYFHTWNLARGLWDRWEPTNEQSRVWEMEFKHKNQAWVQDCLREHYTKSKWLRPDISAVRTLYRVRTENAATVIPGRNNWRVDHEDDRNTRDGHEAIKACLLGMPQEDVLQARDEWFAYQLDRARSRPGPMASGEAVIRRRREECSDDPGEWGVALRAYVWHWLNGMKEQLTAKGGGDE